MRKAGVIGLLTVLAWSTAYADEPPPTRAADPGAPAAEQAPAAGEVDPFQVPLTTVPWKGLSGQGVSLSYHDGSWGGHWTQGVSVFFPLLRAWGVRLRGITVFGEEDLGTAMAAGGRLELIGRSPVYLNLVRLYGGGGAQCFGTVGEAKDTNLHFGGGGFFGFEFFLVQKMGFFLELGGNGGAVDQSSAGATIEAGMHAYPF